MSFLSNMVQLRTWSSDTRTTEPRLYWQRVCHNNRAFWINRNLGLYEKKQNNTLIWNKQSRVRHYHKKWFARAPFFADLIFAKKNKLQNWYPRPFPRVPKLQESQENLNESGLMLVLTFGANLLPIKHYQCVKQTRKPRQWKTYSNCKLAYYI